MALTPQIDGNIISLEQTEKVLPSKTYKINNDVVSTEIEIEEGKPTVVESDEMITIDDLSYEQISLNIKGNSWQETREGYNILQNIVHKDDETYTINGITFTKNKDGSVTANGTATATAAYNFVSENYNARKNISAGNYTISGCPSGGGNNVYKMTLGLTGVSEFYDLGNSCQFTVSADNTYYFKIQIQTGQTVSNLTFYPMLIRGTTAKPYEQYGAMPSPEFRSEIKNVTGSVNVILCNKNLLKTLKWITGTYIYAKLPKLNSEYFLSLRLKDGKTIPSDLYFGFSRDGDYNSTGFTKWLIDKGEFSSYNSIDRNTFKYTSNIRYDGTILGYIAIFPATYAGNLEEYFDIQLEEKINYNHATDYVESESQQITFPLAEGQRMYKDSYLADDGVHHTWREYIITGNEGWILGPVFSGAVGTRFDAAVYTQPRAGDNEVICTHYAYNGTNKKGCWVKATVETKALDLRIQDETITTVKDLTAFLQEQYANGTPVTIQYPLFEEIIEPYTEEQQLVYNEMSDILIESSVINIFSNDEIKPFVKVIYFSADNIIFNTGEKDRIIGYADGLEAIKQAIYHILNTERYAYLIYDDNYGVEFEQYIGKDFNFIQATIEDTLREALTHDLRITDVMVNSIDKIDSNVVAINFTATTVYGDLVLGVNINV